MEETISLQDIFKIIKKRLVHIVSITIIAALIAGVISFFLLTPIYQASTQILVNKESTDQQAIQTQDIQANLQLINTYNVIIKSPAILSKVIDTLDLNLTPTELTNKITVASQDNSQVVNVSVQDENPAIAVEIANTTAEVFQQEIRELMNVDNVNILSPAVLSDNPSPVKPNKMLNVAIGVVIGLMLGLGLAFLLEYLDTSIKSEQDVEDILGLPIIGIVSPIPDDQPVITSNLSRRGRGN
ncbi:Wzz/FepE/Etk N-terminal domain-containing protein [Ureibacillus chungkukjangi]|uniref:YveK family protein n=1 Tax=Ureibacillus chungkukjangi TaxID=1202712 RepID=UPI0020423E0E|nr:Wzz/FepE/Etk N-terminal domain-containing protein [Ureibacillus chungkukjangi]